MWTAEQARKIAEQYKYLEEIQEFDHQILEAVNQGNTYVYYYKKMSQYVKDRFEDLGYTIKISESPESDDGYITFIYW